MKKKIDLLRPANLIKGSPGRGYEIYFSKDKKYKIGVINLMGNVFMRKTEDVFQRSKKNMQENDFKKRCRFSCCRFSWRDNK